MDDDRENECILKTFFRAVEGGDLKTIEMILESGVDVNSVRPIIGFESKRMRREVTLLAASDKWRGLDTPLHVAVLEGNEEVVTTLVRYGADVNAEAGGRLTPLQLAAKGAHLRIADHLIKHGASTDSLSPRLGYTPLHFACESGNLEVVTLFLNTGANVNKVSIRDSVTPLHLATKNGHKKIVRLLIEHGAQVDIQDKHGNTSLSYAVEFGYMNVVEEILRYNPDAGIPGNRNALLVAVQSHRKELKAMVKVLLNYGLNVGPGDSTDAELFHGAIANGHLKIVEDLVKYGSDVNKLYRSALFKPTDETISEKGDPQQLLTSVWNLKNDNDRNLKPLQCATKNRQLEISALLIRYGAKVNAESKNGDTAMHFAVQNSDLKMVNLLLSSGATVNDKPTIFFIAVINGNLGIVYELLKHGVDIEACDSNGRTALHLAAVSKDSNVEIVKMLLCRGSDIEAENDQGKTPLHEAITMGHEKIVETLLEYNANVKCNLKKGNTLLHVAAKEGNVAITKMLLNKGLDIEAQTDDGSAALHVATEEGHTEVVKLLLESGADVDSKRTRNYTPLISLEKDVPEVVELLLKYGADVHAKTTTQITAIHVAAYHGLHKCVKVLLEHGSNINDISSQFSTAAEYALDGLKGKGILTKNESPFYYNFEDSDAEDDVEDLSLASEYVHFYIAKMHAANMYLIEENLDAISDTPRFQNYEVQCKEEISCMKTDIIPETNITIHDILSKDVNSLARYMRNEKLKRALKTRDYEAKYPKYADLLKRQIRKGTTRRDLLEEGIDLCHIFFNNSIALPHDCMEKIFLSLDNKDLRNFASACKSE